MLMSFAIKIATIMVLQWSQQLTRIIGTTLASYVGLFMMHSPINMVKNLLIKSNQSCCYRF